MRDDEAMQKTVESIARSGVLSPGIVRPRPEGGYEIIAGHRRKRGSELAGRETMPVLVRKLDDDEATALLIAECLDDYYRTGELTVTDYVGEKYDPVDHHIKEFIVTPDDLKILLGELQSVQDPGHWKYQGWIKDSDRERWLAHIRSVYQTLQEHT